jgi:hypothetical protein
VPAEPKAPVCHGLLVRWADPGRADGWKEHAWLRLAGGRPVSAVTTPFRAGCCGQLQVPGKAGLLLV